MINKNYVGIPKTGIMITDPNDALEEDRINKIKAYKKKNPWSTAFEHLGYTTQAVGNILGGVSNSLPQKSNNKPKANIEESGLVEPFADTSIGPVYSSPNPNFTADLTLPMNIKAMGGSVQAQGSQDAMLQQLMQQGQLPGMGGQQVPVEMEGGEQVLTPGGDNFQLQGPNHTKKPGEPGSGIKGAAEEGTIVFSKRIKREGKSMAERERLRIKKAEKLLKQLEENPDDKILVQTVERTLMALEAEREDDIHYQEEMAAIEERKKALTSGEGLNPQPQQFPPGMENGLQAPEGLPLDPNMAMQSGGQPPVDPSQIDPAMLEQLMAQGGAGQMPMMALGGRVGNGYSIHNYNPYVTSPLQEESMIFFPGQDGYYENQLQTLEYTPDTDDISKRTHAIINNGLQNSETRVISKPLGLERGPVSQIDVQNPVLPTFTSNFSTKPLKDIKPSKGKKPPVDHKANMRMAGDFIGNIIPGAWDMVGTVGNFEGSKAKYNDTLSAAGSSFKGQNRFKDVGNKADKQYAGAIQNLNRTLANQVRTNNDSFNSLLRTLGNNSRGIGSYNSNAIAALAQKQKGDRQAYNDHLSRLANMQTQKAQARTNSEQIQAQGWDALDLARAQHDAGAFTLMGQATNDKYNGITALAKNFNEAKLASVKGNLAKMLSKYFTVDSNGNLIRNNNVAIGNSNITKTSKEK